MYKYTIEQFAKVFYYCKDYMEKDNQCKVDYSLEFQEMPCKHRKQAIKKYNHVIGYKEFDSITLGLCNFKEKKLYFNMLWLTVGMEYDAIKTIIHELLHAIRPNMRHGVVFRSLVDYHYRQVIAKLS
jgi:hypothetical protein